MDGSGGSFESLPGGSMPVTWGFILICVAVFLVWNLALSPPGPMAGFMRAHFGLSVNGLLQHGYVHTLLTTSVSHIGFWHILMNLILFFVFARRLERSAWFGSANLVWLIIAASIIEGLSHVGFLVAQDLNPNTIAIGASGVVMAMAVLVGFRFPDERVDLVLFVTTMKWFVIGVLVLSLLPILQRNPNDGVAHAAHLGGVVAGLLFHFIDLRLFRRHGYQVVGVRSVADGSGILARIARRSNRSRSAADRRPAAPSRPASDDHLSPAARARMDQILEKISRSGMDSLSAEERTFLEEESRAMKDKQRK